MDDTPITDHEIELEDGTRVCCGVPRRTYSGKGPFRIPILIGAGPRYDVYDWLPLTASVTEQVAGIRRAADAMSWSASEGQTNCGENEAP